MTSSVLTLVNANHVHDPYEDNADEVTANDIHHRNHSIWGTFRLTYSQTLDPLIREMSDRNSKGRKFKQYNPLAIFQHVGMPYKTRDNIDHCKHSFLLGSLKNFYSYLSSERKVQ